MYPRSQPIRWSHLVAFIVIVVDNVGREHPYVTYPGQRVDHGFQPVVHLLCATRLPRFAVHRAGSPMQYEGLNQARVIHAQQGA